jgi:O-antigen/teichoic acid export membrane protein
MKQPTSASSKVAFNTGILYAKMLLTMGVSLYSTRVVLNALGTSDYGIFNLIAGVIAMLSFLNVAMTVSTQRYLSYHQGTKNFSMQKKIFSNSWVLHIFIGLLVVALLEIICPFLFNGFLNIPIDRIPSAKIIYHFMSVAIFFTITSVPFTASLNAHENMLWVAVVNTIESILKLGTALSLSYFVQNQRLIVFGILTAGISVFSLLLYAGFCLNKYAECNVKNYQIDKPLIKELGTFAGWTLFGSLCSVSKTQGLAVLLNIFFSTMINTAYGIANQVAGQMNFLSATLLRVLNPQIMKSEGMDNRQRMLRLSMMASKFGYFFLAFIAIPCIFEMPAILKFWLKNVPEYAVVFCSLVLITTLINQLTIGLQAAVQAIGRIKKYQAIVGSILLFNLPISYFLLKSGFPAPTVLVSSICFEFIACMFRLFYLKKMANLSIREYFSRVFFKEAIPTLLAILMCWLITVFINFQFRFLFTGIVSTLIFFIGGYFTGLSKDERSIVNALFLKLNKRLTSRSK